MDDLLIKVFKVKGTCPVYKEGDSFRIVEGYKLQTEKKLCMHSLVSIIPYCVALSRGVSAYELGLSKNVKV